MINILSKILGLKKPWEKDINKFLKNADSKDLDKYAKTLEKGEEFDFTNPMWGHAVNMINETSELVSHVSGFYNGFRKIREGDILILKTENGKTGKFLVLKTLKS